MNKINKSCPFCVFNEKSKTYKIIDLNFGGIYLNYNQSYLGRCLYIPFEHYDLFSDIPMDMYLQYSKEIFSVADTIQKIMNADLMNIAMLCNQVSHVHWHLIPRYNDDSNYGNPPWPNEPKQLSANDTNKLIELLYNSLKIKQK